MNSVVTSPAGHGLTAEYATSCEPAEARVRVLFGGEEIADSTRTLVFHETRLPPVYYFPREDVRMDLLRPTAHLTHCPFKGNASYWSIEAGGRVAENAVWSYEDPYEVATDISGYLAFYSDKMDAWYVDDAELFARERSESVFGENPLVEWLLREGWEAANSRELTRRFVVAMCDAGFPVKRLRVFIRTLHPLLAATGYTWADGEEEVARFEISHDATKSDIFLSSPLKPVLEGAGGVRRAVNAETAEEFSILKELYDEGMTDYVAVPMAFSDGQMNAITMATDAEAGFTVTQLGQIHEILPVLSRLYEVQSKRRNAATLMRTFLGARTGERVLEGYVQRGDGEDIHAVIWFCDLRNSTALAESMGRDAFLRYLNQFFDCMAGAVDDYGGEVLRFIGDAVLAIFPIADGESHAACEAALDAAQQAARRIDVLNGSANAAGRTKIGYGIGLHVGDVTYGNIGTPDRLEFTVIGAAANEAARMEAMTKDLGVPLIISETFAAEFGGDLKSLGRHGLRGVGHVAELFTLPDD